MQWIRAKACNGLGIDQDLFDACASGVEAQQDLAGFLEGGTYSFLSCIDAISQDTKVYMHECAWCLMQGHMHLCCLYTWIQSPPCLPGPEQGNDEQQREEDWCSLDGMQNFADVCNFCPAVPL